MDIQKKNSKEFLDFEATSQDFIENNASVNRSGNSDVDVNVNVEVDTTAIAYAMACFMFVTGQLNNNEFNQMINKLDDLIERKNEFKDTKRKTYYDNGLPNIKRLTSPRKLQ
jgi:hypothetical protein